jgi:KaiC/GvpD/RAD55 family RecA-like ATPase
LKASTGITRLDELLGGGLPQSSTTLVYGPPFAGKNVVARGFLLSGMRAGVPGIFITTDRSANDVRARLAASDPNFPKYEKAGLAMFVDTYSKAVGTADNNPSVEYVDGLMNFNALSVAVNNLERKIIKDHETHRVAFDSTSTLVAYTNASTAFRYLQVLIGKTKAAGATNMLLLAQGMHKEEEVQMIKHLVDGVIELRKDKMKNFLNVEGLGITRTPGWVEYGFTENALEITGSFGAGRIR